MTTTRRLWMTLTSAACLAVAGFAPTAWGLVPTRLPDPDPGKGASTGPAGEVGTLAPPERDPFEPTVDELHFQAGYSLVARGLKELERWFYDDRAAAPWNSQRQRAEDFGSAHATYGEGELPLGSFYDAYPISPPPCQSELEYNGGTRGGQATQDYRDYLTECQHDRDRMPHWAFDRTEEWKFLQRIDLHEQMSRHDFPAGQFLTVRLGNASHQGGEGGYDIQTLGSPQGTRVQQSSLVSARDWYFSLSPGGDNCVSGRLLVHLPDVTLQIDPARVIANWLDHGWGVRFPGAHVVIVGLSAQPSFTLCVGRDLEPRVSVGDQLNLAFDHVNLHRDGPVDVDSTILGIGIPGVEQLFDAVGNLAYIDATSRSRVNRMFGPALARAEQGVRIMLDAELQKLAATLPRVQPSLRDGCAALDRALGDGILDVIEKRSTRAALQRLVSQECRALADDTASVLVAPPRFDPTPWSAQHGCYESWANPEEALAPGGGSWASYQGQDWYFDPASQADAPAAPGGNPWEREAGCRVDAVARVSLPDGLWPVMKCVTADVNAWLHYSRDLNEAALAQDVKLDCYGEVLTLADKLERFGSGNRVALSGPRAAR